MLESFSSFKIKCILTAAALCPLEAQLRVFVETHSPQFDHIFGAGGDQREPITAGSRRNLPRTQTRQKVEL